MLDARLSAFLHLKDEKWLVEAEVDILTIAVNRLQRELQERHDYNNHLRQRLQEKVGTSAFCRPGDTVYS